MKSINEINTKTKEGRMLMAALAKLTTESQKDKEPDEVVKQVSELADAMYPEPIQNTPTVEFIQYLKNDTEYFKGFEANLATSFYDECKVFKEVFSRNPIGSDFFTIGNIASRKFINTLINENNA